MSEYPAWRIPMKALLSKHPGGPEPLVLDEFPEPVPGSKEVRVAVRACGVNYPDLLIIQDLYQYKPPRPFAPGAEIAGVVDAVGEGVEHLHTGDRVLMSPVRNGMAEKAVGLASNCWKIPDAMPFDQAAALIMTYGTSQHALKDRAQLRAKETLLVLGAAGGVGLAAGELGKAMGGRVIAAAWSAEKVARAAARGGAVAGRARGGGRGRRGAGCGGWSAEQGRPNIFSPGEKLVGDTAPAGRPPRRRTGSGRHPPCTTHPPPAGTPRAQYSGSC